ncbi:unnamed protein product [Rhizopus stolonifer]
MAYLLANVTNLLVNAKLVYEHVSKPYMDEIFHVPQAQQYCQGDYLTWDPKLTTPPGLYIISNIFEYLAKSIGFHYLCTVNALRATNILFSIGLYFIFCSFFKRNKLYALVLAWFPVGHFYNFLYYTDSGSTFFVLLSYLLLTKKRYHLSGIVGLISLTFRQTNVIWVCLFMMLAIIDILSTRGLVNPPSNSVHSWSKKQNTHPHIYIYIYSFFLIDLALSSIISLIHNTFKHLFVVLPNIITFLFTILAFAAFLVWNDGIVLGDKSNHVAGLHFPQLFYFTSFLSFFSFPWTLTQLPQFILQLSIKRVLYSLVFVFIALFFVYRYTYEHPFLLADNRHYSFYVWRKIYKRHWIIRYLLVPFYIISGQFNLQRLGKNTFLFNLGYLVALILTLAPSPLLEFRYFIIPFLFYMIHTPPQSNQNTWLALVFYVCLQIATMVLFIYKPFTWPNEPEEFQRFIW